MRMQRIKSSILRIITIIVAVTIFVRPAQSERNFPPRIEKQPPADFLPYQVANGVDENDKPYILECEASGIPQPRYKWTKNGKPFNWQAHDDRISQQPGRGTLVVMRPRDEDAGQYQCFATNELGTASSNSVFLRKAELNNFADEGEVQALEAEERKPFKIPCNAPDGWPIPQITWLLQSQQGALKPINSSRLTVDPDGTLWFSTVEKEDKSTDLTYVCSAYSSVRNKYKLGNRVYLSVSPASNSTVVPGFPPTFLYGFKSPTTVAFRGAKLELWCIVGGNPIPEIQWTKNGGELSVDRVEFGNYGKTLRIFNVSDADAGSYECFAASNGIGPSISGSFDVRVYAAPYFTKELEPINAAEEETIELVCEVKGQPAPLIEWIHNGKPIGQAPENPRRSIVNGNKIIIRNLIKSDTGNYGCNASNSYGYVYKDVYINVLNMPAEIISPPKDEVSFPGETVKIQCGVLGVPQPLVRWFRDEHELITQRYKILDNGDLEISSVSVSDSGLYSCFASNKFGNASKSGNLVVRAPDPTVITFGPQDTEVIAGSSVVFYCIASTDASLQYSVEWYLDDELIDYESQPRFLKSQDDSLTVSNVTDLDSGKFTCLAKTKYDNTSVTASLIVQDVPNSPEIILINCSPRYARIKWKSMGDNGSPILHYTIEYNTNFNPDSWKIAIGNISSTSFKAPMAPGTKYSFRITALNSIGPSLPSSSSETCTTPPDVPFKNPDNVKTSKTIPNTLLISWTPMPEIEHNAPNFQYEVKWKLDEPEAEWTTQIINDWKISSLLISNQPVYKPYLIKIGAINEKGRANVEPLAVRGLSGQDTSPTAPSNVTVLYSCFADEL